jgi:hypothetical protein
MDEVVRVVESRVMVRLHAETNGVEEDLKC